MSKTQIPTGGIADDAISEEHLDATAITGTTALAATPDATDEILISDGGTLKRLDFSHLNNSGWVKVHSITASNDATINFDNNYLTTTYKTYMFVVEGLNNASDGQQFRMQVSVDNGSSFLSGISKVQFLSEDDDSGITLALSDEGASHMDVGQTSKGNATGESTGATVWIWGSQDSNSWINVNSHCTSWGNSMELTYETSGFGARSTSNLNYVRFNMASGNITSGTFTLYGVG